ncbi:hypothetical protein TSAR_011767, partial [Trichomalopsis sarcophagae]
WVHCISCWLKIDRKEPNFHITQCSRVYCTKCIVLAEKKMLSMWRNRYYIFACISGVCTPLEIPTITKVPRSTGYYIASYNSSNSSSNYQMITPKSDFSNYSNS